MTDDGSFKGRGGARGRRATVISMSAHKSRHSAEQDELANRGANPPLTLFDFDPEEHSDQLFVDKKQFATAEKESAQLATLLGQALPCENSPFELDGQGKNSGGQDWSHKTSRSGSVVESFYHAFNGLKSGFTTQRNVRVHCCIAAVVFSLAILLRVDSVGLIALTLATGLVFFAEYINTAIEHVTDIQADFSYHPSARLAKDTAAAAVTITALTAVIVGAVVFLPRLLALLPN